MKSSLRSRRNTRRPYETTMDEFKKRLTAVRMGAKKAVGKGVDTFIDKQKGVTDARRERNRLLEENAGPVAEDSELFDSPYKKPAKAIKRGVMKAKGFFDRLASVRGSEKEEWSPENQ